MQGHPKLAEFDFMTARSIMVVRMIKTFSVVGKIELIASRVIMIVSTAGSPNLLAKFYMVKVYGMQVD